MKPFVIHSGFIFSVNDKERHLIPGSELIRLWKLPKELCSIDHDQYLTEAIMGAYPQASYGSGQMPIYIAENQLHLFPDATGKYLLPLKMELFKQKQISEYIQSKGRSK